MKQKLLLFLLLFFTFQLQAADYYWVGGGGNWSNVNHWRLGSTSGSIPSIVPAAGDNVFFDAGSGFGTTTATRTVTVDANSFCNNMTWDLAVPNNPIITGSGTSRLSIYGNFTLAPTVTYSSILVDILGGTNSVLTTNGIIMGRMTLTINKPGSGVTLADDLIYNSPGNSNNVVNLVNGSLYAAGKTITAYSLASSGAGSRNMEISNARVNTQVYGYQGTNKVLNASKSVIKTTRFYADAGLYHIAEIATASDAYLAINNVTIQKITFTSTLSNSLARIHSNNTVDTLLFLGSGSIRNNNNSVNHVVFHGLATIGGSGNVIKFAEAKSRLQIIDAGNNVFDTLLTAPNQNISIAGTNTINKYFRAGGLPCDGFTEITGSSAATLNFASGAVADIDNVLLSNITASGSITPITVNGIDNEGNTGFVINQPAAGSGTTLYWVGGAGDWNDKSHWSTSSGGTPGACIPFVNDDVVFDINSGFTAGNNTVVTTGNTYCNNMSWLPGVPGSPILNESGSFGMQVYGSVILEPSVTMNAALDMRGINNCTLTTNGSTLGALQVIVRKSAPSAATGLRLLDNWNNSAASIILLRGVLDLHDRTLNISGYSSTGASGRYVNISNANISIVNWTYQGTNISMDATKSYLLCSGNLVVRDLAYNIVDCSAAHDNFDIYNSTFGQLTFTNTSLTSGARITLGNTIRKLEYKGAGMIRSGDNTIDSLITAENRNFYFYEGNNTINKYFKSTHPNCAGLGEIKTNGNISTVTFGANAVVDIANVYMENIAAAGGGGTLNLPIPFNGADAGGNSGWTITTSTGGARYWVGGSGDWNDASHWSTTSGGTGGACVPTVGDDVFFDAGSGFTTTSKTVTVNTGNAYFHNMDWSGSLNAPILNKAGSWTMESWGNSIKLNPDATLNILPLVLKGSEATILTGQTKGNFDLEIRKPGGSLTLANDYTNTQTDFSLIEGDFNASNRLLNIANIGNNGLDNAIAVDVSGSTINGNWQFDGGTIKRSLNAANTIFNSDTFIASGFVYNIVNVTGTVGTSATISNTTIPKLTLHHVVAASPVGINGSNNTLGRVEFKGGGVIYGTNNVIDTLIFFPGNTYQFASGSNTTITGDWFGSGTPCRLTEIKSSSVTVPATITKTSGTVDFDYVRLLQMSATGGGIFSAKEHSTDMGGNTGWDISSYNGAAPILGLGPDLGLKNSEMPYTIKTEGFFGSPLSQYKWEKDGSILSTNSELIVTEPGTYKVTVNFPDGCSIADEIIITLVSADLSIVKTVNNSTPAVGEDVIFTLVAHNAGPAAGTEVIVTDKLPDGYAYVSDTAPTGTTYDAITGLWTIGSLALNADATITITAKVNAAGSYLNEATITGTSDDPDPANNSSSVSLVPSSSLIITQPTCAIETGTIEIPLVTGGTYSIDGGTTFLASNIFADLVPDDYSVVVKVGANISAAISVTINEAPAAPDAPVSIGNQSVCAMNPIQTLTATATVPAGSTIIWYDAPSGGNMVSNPVLNSLGSVVYYAEANNGTCNSKSRTAVILSINNSPVINTLADQIACETYTFPVITGTNLSGNEAYYTAQNGEGTKYQAGTVLNNPGTQTLYIYDKEMANAACSGDISVTTNTSLSDNVFIHQYFTSKHHYYTGSINSDFWKGAGNQSIVYGLVTGSEVYSSLVGDLNISQDPACVTGLVEIIIGATFKNEGPSAGTLYSGHLTIINKLTGEMVYTKPIQDNFSVGATVSYTGKAIVSSADLLSGNLAVILGVETAHGGNKNWTISNFKATYKYFSEVPCPDEKSFQLTINPLPSAPISGGDQLACATNPVQTLTATATASAGTTINWYDAITGGNIVTAPILNTVGSVTYYAETVSNNCASSSRTPVRLTINPSPVIDPIADLAGCGSITLPTITGTNLSGTQSYYTGINKTGSKYNSGDVYNTLGETTLYAYDESTNASTGSSKAALELERDLNYTSAKLLEMFPDNSRVFGRVTNGTLANGGTFTSLGPLTSDQYNVVVGKLTLPSGYSNNQEEYVQVSVEDGWFRSPTYPSAPPIPGYAGQIAIINTATNQLLYQTSYNDLPEGSIRPTTVAGLVPTSDLIAGNIGIFMEFKSSAFRISEVSVQYQFLSNEMICSAQQSFKVTINEIPDAPISGGNQEVCAESPLQTLTATATVPSGSTVVWYDAATAGNVVANPILNTVGTVTYYAETHTGDCISATRTKVDLTIHDALVLIVNNPAVVCHPATINITVPAITTGSTTGLDFTYFEDANATIPLTNPSAVAVSGTYYIKGTNPNTGCSTVVPVIVQFVDKPEVLAVHPDCVSGTGSINITSPLGTDFEYSIDNGVTYQAGTAFNNLTAGNYSVTARNTLVPGCESDPNVIVINATPTTAMPLVLQPDCDQTEGSIEFPVNAAYEYSIDGAPFTGGNVFTGLTVGPHSIRSRKVGDVCIADPVSITIVASTGRPAAPVAADQQACAASPIQTLTATATVPIGSTLKWYTEATGGNLVSSPTLSAVGTIVYYAESNTVTCASTTRTPVRLTITPVPVINVITDKNVCESLTLPVIAGTNLSGNQAYYTAPNGGGTKYNAGAVFSVAGETTLYAYDINTVASPGTSCPAETSFKVLIRNTTAGTITADQTICKNTIPTILTSTTGGTGSGSIKYKWESSTTSASAGFSVIAGATLTTYTPSALTATTWFRRTTISSYNGVVCESSPTTAIKITVQDEVNPGTISGNQTICNNTVPIALSSATAATGLGTISYLWESSTTDDLTGFTVIGGATQANYSPTALTTTTWFRRVAIATDGATICISAPTSAIKIIVQDPVTAGTISPDQTICNDTGTTLNSVTAGTGFGTISYRWESSTTSASTGFTPIANAVAANYSPTALTTTTWFRRITIAKLDGVTCESNATMATAIVVQDEVLAGAIGTNQTICTNSVPVALSSLTDGTGSGTISYRWEKSSASAPAFAAIPGETLASYSPGALTETTWFRRISISSLSGVQCESEPTALIEITVQGVTSPGAIAAIQTICNGNIPEPLTSITAGTGSGTITYRWESSTTDALSGFTSIPSATAANYAPAALSTTTWFRRIAISTVSGSACESVPTVAVAINVQEPVTAGSIGADQVICNNTTPAVLTSVAAGTGSGTISYRWESSSFATTGFTAIQNALADSYSPTAITTSLYFRRITISTKDGVRCESVPTTAVKVTVQDPTTAGAISEDQTICANAVPLPLTSSIVGTGSGVISYRWESSTVNATTGFTTIAMAQSANYTPAALSVTTYFRRITTSTESGQTCESTPTSVVTITVQDVVTAGSIGTDQVICNNTIPAVLTSVSAGTGSGTISYRWESSTTSATTGFTTLPGETMEDYTPLTALTATNYFRRISISTEDGIECESAPSAVVTITVQTEVTPGMISGNQTICKGSIPAAFTSSADGTGSGTLSYRWESSVIDRNTGFVTITGATAQGYTPAAVSVTTYFRRVTISTQSGTECESVPTSVVIVEVNSAPVIANQNRTTEEGNMLSSQINGADIEGDALTFSKNTDPENGVAVVNADGSYTYMPNPGYSGIDAFIIAVSDGCEISIATITVTVTPGPKPSISVVKTGVFAENYITYSFTIKNTGNVPVFDLMLTDANLGIVNKNIDVAGGLLPGLSITVTEKYVLSQEDKEVGTVTNTATVTAVDSRGNEAMDVSGTAEANNIATVTTVAKPLVAEDDHHEANANKVITENVLSNDDTMGQDINKLTVEVMTQPQNGKLVQNTDGTFTYTPNPGFTGTDSYTYRIKDQYGYYSNVATVSFKTNFFDIKVPTLFTPNGDGINETFEIRGLNQFADNELSIVNRWGNEVYKMKNYQNNWSGEGLSEGTYYYVLRVKTAGSNEWSILKGYTTIVRGFRK